MDTYDITLVDDLIAFYGCRAVAARRFLVSEDEIDAYLEHGVPSGWAGRVILDLVAADKTFNPAVFGLDGEHPGAAKLNSLVRYDFLKRGRRRRRPVAASDARSAGHQRN